MIEKFLSSWLYFSSISQNCQERLLSMVSWNLFHSGFFPLCPLFLIPLDEEEELLLCLLGEKCGFLTVFGVGTRRGRWRFLFDRIWARVFGVVKTSVFIMSGSHDATVRASVERAVFSVVSEMVALGAEVSFAMFHWCSFEG